MNVGDVTEVTAGDCTDLYYVDTGMYDTDEYGAAYLIDAHRPAIVETGIGTNVDRIVSAADDIGIDREAVEVIAVTHVHLDHAGGAGALSETYPNATVFVPSAGADHLVDPSRLVAGTKRAVGDVWEFYTEPTPIPEVRIDPIDHGDTIDLGSHELRVHEAPGHAPHQVVFEEPTTDAVFTADAAGIWIPSLERTAVTTPPPQFDLDQALSDLDTIGEIDPSVLLYTHFGPRYVGDNPTDQLSAYGQQLTEWVDRVAEKRAELEDDAAVIEYFVDRTALDAAWGERRASDEAAMNVRGVLTYLDRRDA